LLPWVPWVFLVLCVAGAGFTLNALRPVKGGRVLLIPAFLSSWLVNEMVAHHFVWQLVATVAFVWLGALTAWPGWLGLALTAVSWASMLWLWRRGRLAGRIVHRSLESFVSSDPWPRVPAYKLWLPFSMGRRGVRRLADVEYGRVGKKRLLLDVYLPREAGRLRPAVIQIHGGGWVLGSKNEQGLPLVQHLASHGFVCFAIDYRLSPRATFPDHLVDVKRALAWVREHADEYGVDPSFVAVTGGSAGGHLTALAALTQNDPTYQPGFEDADTSVQAAVPFYGVYCFRDRLGLFPPEFFDLLLEPLVMKANQESDPEAYRLASPLDRVDERAPPFFVVHGDKDTLAPVEYARAFVDALRSASREPVCYVELPGAQHAFDVFHSPRTVRVVEGVERFLSEVRRRALDGRAERVAAGPSAIPAPEEHSAAESSPRVSG